MGFLTEKDIEFLHFCHNELKNNDDLNKAVNEYTNKHGLSLPDTALYVPGIDFVSIEINGVSVLIINLPPVSNYSIDETEHTSRYLRSAKALAV